MARNARFDLPGIPRHLIQRGDNRELIDLQKGERDLRFRLLASKRPPLGTPWYKASMGALACLHRGTLLAPNTHIAEKRVAYAMVPIAILMPIGVFYFQKLWVLVVATAALVVLLSYLAWFEKRKLKNLARWTISEKASSNDSLDLDVQRPSAS